MQGAENGSKFNEFKKRPVTDSKDSICSRTDTKLVHPNELYARIRRNLHQEGRTPTNNDGNLVSQARDMPKDKQRSTDSPPDETKREGRSQEIPYELDSIMVRDMLVEIGAIGRVKTEHKATETSPIEVVGDFDYIYPSHLFLRRTDKMCIHPVFSLQYNCPDLDHTRVLVSDSEVAKFFEQLAAMKRGDPVPKHSAS